LIDLPRPFVEARKVVSFLTTFMWWYLAFVNILKGTTSALLDSIMHCPCLCLINFPISRIKD
jgi:hypothetical protein